MSPDVSAGSLFERPPLRMGLRGDAHVWRAMGEALAAVPLPDDQWRTRSLLLRTFEQVAGFELPDGPDVPESREVPQFVTGSGMSDGSASPAWWRATGIEILMDRAAGIRGWR